MLNRFKTTSPVWCVAFAFVLTVAAARWVSQVKPGFHYNVRGMHIHHYVYGIFMLTIAGYLGLVFKGPKATFWIALLYGWGAGFTFDEMGMWLNSSLNQGLRKNPEGVIIGMLALTLLCFFSIALKKQPQASPIKAKVLAGRDEPDNNRFDERTIEPLAAGQQD
jgi:hypothetical protein